MAPKLLLLQKLTTRLKEQETIIPRNTVDAVQPWIGFVLLEEDVCLTRLAVLNVNGWEELDGWWKKAGSDGRNATLEIIVKLSANADIQDTIYLYIFQYSNHCEDELNSTLL